MAATNRWLECREVTDPRELVDLHRVGRPLAVGLDRALPGQVWESSHLGGDRFAANVVSLPDGIYHGGLISADADALADALRSGRVLLPAYEAWQDAQPPYRVEHLLRSDLRLLAVAAVRHAGAIAAAGDTTAVDLFVPDGTHTVSPCDPGARGGKAHLLRPMVASSTPPTSLQLVSIAMFNHSRICRCRQGRTASVAP